MLSEAEVRASHILERNRKALDAVVALLLERETISGTDLAATVKSNRSDTDVQPTLAGL